MREDRSIRKPSILAWVFLFFIVASLVGAMYIGFNRQEIADCTKWAVWIKESAFRLNAAQLAQCKFHNISIGGTL